MFRPRRFSTMTFGVAVVACLLACADRSGSMTQPAYAQGPSGPAATSSPAATPIPFDPDTEPPPCPPASYSHTNATPNQEILIYTCSRTSSTSIALPVGDTIVFDGDGNGQCTGCDDNDDKCNCIECELTQLIVNGTIVFTCELQQAYFIAYGLDIAAESVEGTVPIELPKPRYDDLGHRMTQWAVPVLDRNRQLVGWDFTTFRPVFSVENGEIIIRSKPDSVLALENGKTVIRDRPQRVIGGPEGITIDEP